MRRYHRYHNHSRHHQHRGTLLCAVPYASGHIRVLPDLQRVDGEHCSQAPEEASCCDRYEQFVRKPSAGVDAISLPEQ